MKESKSKQSGPISEAQFVLCALKRGWEITAPIRVSSPYDFVIRMTPDESWKSVQVKTVYEEVCGSGVKRKVFSLRKRQNGKNVKYAPGDFDFMAAVDGEKVWMIPSAVINQASTTLSTRNLDDFLINDTSVQVASPSPQDIEQLTLQRKRSPQRKISQFKAIEIREMARSMSREELSIEFDLSKSSIARILRNESYMQ